MPYLTFAEYTTYGGTLDNPAFSRLEFKTSMLINQHTFGRLKADITYTESVKRLTFELIGLIGPSDVASASYQPKVESEGNDGYSIKFASNTILSIAQVEKAEAVKAKEVKVEDENVEEPEKVSKAVTRNG